MGLMKKYNHIWHPTWGSNIHIGPEKAISPVGSVYRGMALLRGPAVQLST